MKLKTNGAYSLDLASLNWRVFNASISMAIYIYWIFVYVLCMSSLNWKFSTVSMFEQRLKLLKPKYKKVTRKGALQCWISILDLTICIMSMSMSMYVYGLSFSFIICWFAWMKFYMVWTQIIHKSFKRNIDKRSGFRLCDFCFSSLWMKYMKLTMIHIVLLFFRARLSDVPIFWDIWWFL